MPIKSAELFEKMGPLLEKTGAEIVKKIQAIYAFEIREKKDSEPVIYTVDLKNGNGTTMNI
jgi:hypothetical protein